jgi:hypothetical protein
VPTQQPGGDGVRLALTIGNDVMAAIVAERFNPKWNRATASPFYTNSYQQDYPQLELVDIGWGEDVDKVDINNTAMPKPTNAGTAGGGMIWRRQLSRTSLATWPVNQICWMYNQDMVYGQNSATLGNPASWGAASWPGPGVTLNPQITPGPVIQNPILSMIDANGNLLIVPGPVTAPLVTANEPPLTVAYAQRQVDDGLVTLFILGSAVPSWITVGQTFVQVALSDTRFNGIYEIISTSTGYSIGGHTYYGISYVQTQVTAIAQEPVTGTAAYPGPALAAGAAEGTVVLDGTVPWTVVAPMSQGFRVSPLPNASGPVYQITPYYQMLLEPMETLQSFINPIPDDQKYVFQEGVEWMCKKGSPNPADRAEAMKMWPLWLKSLEGLLKQNDREPDAYGAIPGSSVVESVYGWRRNPQDPGQPY